MTSTSEPKPKARGHVTIDSELCKGCGLCISVCPKNCLEIGDKPNLKGYYPAQPSKNADQCNACTLCAITCPDIAIEVFRD
jgi:2-oxoglutarate ferredoxin oxidoreductase subunit delta